ncbi:MAG: hypothetical protein U1E36_01390 [Rickettsiales bacterium]
MSLAPEQIDFLNTRVRHSIRDIGNQWKEVRLGFSNGQGYCDGLYILPNVLGVTNLAVDSIGHTITFVIKPADHANLRQHKAVNFIADVIGEPRTVVTGVQPQGKQPSAWELIKVKAPLTSHAKRILATLGSIFGERDGQLIYDGSSYGKVFIANPFGSLGAFGFGRGLFDIEEENGRIRRMVVNEQGIERMAEVGFIPAMRIIMRKKETPELLEKIDKVQAALSSFGGKFTQKNNIVYSMPFGGAEAVRQSHIYNLFENIGGKPFALEENGKAFMALPADDAGKLAVIGIDSLKGLGTHYECVDTAYKVAVMA